MRQFFHVNLLLINKSEIKNYMFFYMFLLLQILNGFNLYIKNGQRVALLGESGSGKSTLLALLQRLYDVDDGMVR